MFGHYSKPLLSPKPRHHDRRAGAATESFRSALEADAVSQPPLDARPVSVRRRSFERLLARRSWVPGRVWLAILVLAGLVAVTGAALHAFATADELEPFDRYPDAYRGLVASVRQSCEAGVSCGFSRGSVARPPADIQRLMSRTGVRSVWHDATVGWTTFKGGYSASFSLLHAAPPTPSQASARALERAREARWQVQNDWWSPPRAEDLGDGWTRLALR